jgi:HEAT repeat protein
MGEAAVPKLSGALRSSANRDLRLAAAFCLIEIGGSDATDALKQALESESDQCVREFIEQSLEQPESQSKSGTKSEPDKDADLLRKRLLAFRCGR